MQSGPEPILHDLFSRNAGRIVFGALLCLALVTSWGAALIGSIVR